MHFASINPANPRTNLLNFWELAILKNSVFSSWPYWIFFQRKRWFFCYFPVKISPNLYGRMNGLKFWCFLWFPENSLLCVKLRYTVYMCDNVSWTFQIWSIWQYRLWNFRGRDKKFDTFSIRRKFIYLNKFRLLLKYVHDDKPLKLNKSVKIKQLFLKSTYQSILLILNTR